MKSESAYRCSLYCFYFCNISAHLQSFPTQSFQKPAWDKRQQRIAILIYCLLKPITDASCLFISLSVVHSCYLLTSTKPPHNFTQPRMEGQRVCFMEPSPEIAGGLCLGRGGSHPPSHIWPLSSLLSDPSLWKTTRTKKVRVWSGNKACCLPFERCLAPPLG